ncbi:MAG: hypothetical protein WCI57_01040 [Candidatus Berkelbacteria bacterium]
MKTKLDPKILSLIGGIAAVVLVIGAFLYMWQNGKPVAGEKIITDVKYKTVEIGTTIADAQIMMNKLSSKATLPVTAPTADKIGKDNPFTP